MQLDFKIVIFEIEGTMKKILLADGNIVEERLDRWLAAQLKELSRTQVAKLVRQGLVLVNNEPVKPSYLLKAGDQVEIEIPPPHQEQVEPERISLDIIYEDDDLVAVNKPSGLVVYPSPGHPRGTLINALLSRCKLANIGAPKRPGVVHRLDQGTSGVIVFAKNDQAYKHLVQQFKRGEVEKRYIALVQGIIAEDEGLIEAPIGRDPIERKRMKITAKGSKRAITEFKVWQRFKDTNTTLLEVYPKTGRTHQIRVHLRYIGHPIVGDTKYGAKISKMGQATEMGQAPRLMLHAQELKLWHPRTGKRMSFVAPLPEEFL